MNDLERLENKFNYLLNYLELSSGVCISCGGCGWGYKHADETDCQSCMGSGIRIMKNPQEGAENVEV